MAQQGYEAQVAAVQVPPELQQLKDVLVRVARSLDERVAALE